MRLGLVLFEFPVSISPLPLVKWELGTLISRVAAIELNCRYGCEKRSKAIRRAGQKKEHVGPGFSPDDVAGTAVASLSGLKPGPTFDPNLFSRPMLT